MSTQNPSGVVLRDRRKAAGFTAHSDAWATFKALTDEAPSLSTFIRWEHDPTRAEPALFAIYCRDVLGCEPADISPELGERADRVLTLLVAGKRKAARHPRQPGGAPARHAQDESDITSRYARRVADRHERAVA